jgi:negative regulator of replication initiation
MIDIKNMNEKEIHEIINACNDELTRREYTQRSEAANKALTALEELVKMAPDCYVDMENDRDLNGDLIFLGTLVEQWKRQNFSFNY